ncbi:MAG: DUF4362 domain-containing protein [Anaerostipes sp.]|nr:DUF4362 domain-containing protein [Anaerostipes sp.]
MKNKMRAFFEKIPNYIIIIIAIIITIPLAMNIVKSSKETSQQQSNMEKGEKVLIVAKSNYNVIISALKQYPEEMSKKEMKDSGFILIENGEYIDDGKKLWNNFCKKIKKEKDGAVLIAQYTVEGDLILKYLSCVNGHFYYVKDSTRDQFGGGYQKYNYNYLKRYEENGAYEVVLTKEKDVMYEDLEKDNPIKKINKVFEIKENEKNK